MAAASKAAQAAPAADVKRMRSRLLRWYGRRGRDLPWRQSSDPYRVLVSEIMLQQTRVATVIPYYRRFLDRFPTLQALADAPVEEVLALWSGLGYYRRARRLHQAARLIVSRHGGSFPSLPEAVKDLPGVGRYTAGAVLSIAFQQPEPVVDGNVSRVLARLLGIEGDVRSGKVSRQVWKRAAELLDPGRPGDFNQALMEMGSLVCTPAAPDCLSCPVADDCRALEQGRQDELPHLGQRAVARTERAAAIVIRLCGSVLLVQRPQKGLLAGLWEFPADEDGHGDRDRLAGALRRRHRLEVEVGEELGEVRHGILERRIQLGVFRGRLLWPPSRTAGRRGWRWVRGPEAMEGGLALAASARKILHLLASTGGRAAAGRGQ
jgi:A/G-specific adenine glycosylase